MNLRRRLQNYIALNNYVEALRCNILPDEYTQLEYITGDGSAYIDLGLSLTQDDSIEISVEFLSATSGQNIFGYRDSARSNNVIVFFASSTNNIVLDFNNSNYADYRLLQNISPNTKYKIYLNKNDRSIYDSTQLVGENNTLCEDVITTGNTYLFFANGNPSSTTKFSGRIYNFKIDNKIYLIPAKRNSDNVVGMFDLVSNKFFTNVNSRGSFIAGPNASKNAYGDKVYLEDSIKDSLSSLNIYGKTIQSKVPEGYTQLEYIQSNGTQYIDTGIKGNGTTKVHINVRYYTSSGAGGSGRIFGSRDAAAVNAFAIGSASGTASTSSMVAFFFGNQSYLVTDKPIILDEWLDIVFDKTTHNINGVDYGDPYNDETFETPQNLKLFGFDNNSSMGVGYVDIAYCKLWDNNVLVCDLVPVKNSSGIIGMYDLVSGQFLTNQGTGSFVAGPNLVPTPDNPIDIYCSNGKITISPNEANYIPDNITLGYWIRNNNGQPESSPTNFYTNMMPVKSNTNYVCYGRRKDNSAISGYNRFAWYDATGTWIRNSTYTQGTIGSDISPENAAFARFHCNIDGSNVTQELIDSYNWTVREGTIEEPFIPYGIITEGTPEKLNIKGNNLYDVTKDVNDKYIDANGNIGDDTSLRACYSDLIPVKSGEMYTYSGICKSSSGVSNAKRIHGYIDGVWNQQIQALNIDINKPFSNTFTIPAGINGVRISHWKDDENTQVEECYRPTKYNNYIDMNLDVANLLSIGDYIDSQDILNGSIIRNVGIKVFDGSENWQNISSYYNISKTDLGTNSTVLPAATTDIICTHYETISGVPNRTSVNVGGSYVNFRDDNISTLADWKQWLAGQYAAGTPVIIIYPLATPTTESTTSQTTLLSSNNNVITRDSEYMNNLGLDLTYKKLR